MNTSKCDTPAIVNEAVAVSACIEANSTHHSSVLSCTCVRAYVCFLCWLLGIDAATANKIIVYWSVCTMDGECLLYLLPALGVLFASMIMIIRFTAEYYDIHSWQ